MLYVGFYDSATVGLYSAVTGEAINRDFITGIASPYDLAIDRTNSQLFVSTSAYEGGRAGIAKFDALTGELQNFFETLNCNPRVLAVDDCGDVYVAGRDSVTDANIIEKLDGRSGAILARRSLGYSQPQALEFVGDRLLFSHSSTVDVLDPRDLSISVPSFIHGFQAWDLLYDGQNRLFVINISSDHLYVVDPFTGAPIDTNFQRGLRDFPFRITLDEAGHIFLADTGVNIIPAVQMYDEDTGALIDATFIAEPGRRPASVVFSPLSQSMAVPEPGAFGILAAAACLVVALKRRMSSVSRLLSSPRVWSSRWLESRQSPRRTVNSF